jgi:hypothetical protein
MMNRPVEAIQQSFLRTKAGDLDSYLRVAELRANSSNNTIFADDKGEIAYLHPQFVPRRDDRFDVARTSVEEDIMDPDLISRNEQVLADHVDVVCALQDQAAGRGARRRIVGERC